MSGEYYAKIPHYLLVGMTEQDNMRNSFQYDQKYCFLIFCLFICCFCFVCVLLLFFVVLFCFVFVFLSFQFCSCCLFVWVFFLINILEAKIIMSYRFNHNTISITYNF